MTAPETAAELLNQAEGRLVEAGVLLPSRDELAIELVAMYKEAFDEPLSIDLARKIVRAERNPSSPKGKSGDPRKRRKPGRTTERLICPSCWSTKHHSHKVEGELIWHCEGCGGNFRRKRSH